MQDIITILHRLTVLDKAKFECTDLSRTELNGWDLHQYKYLELAERLGLENTIECFQIFFDLCARRLLLYMNPNSRDALYLSCSSILQQQSINIKFLEDAVNNLSSKSVVAYKKKTGQYPYTVDNENIPSKYPQSTPEQRISYEVYDVALEQFKVREGHTKVSLPLEDRLIKASKNQVFSVPEAVTNRLIDEYRKYERNIDPDWGYKPDDDDDEAWNLRPIELVPDVSKIDYIEKASDLEKWIETLDNPMDQEIAKLKYIEAPKITVREIAERLDMPKSTIYDRLKPPS